MKMCVRPVVDEAPLGFVVEVLRNKLSLFPFYLIYSLNDVSYEHIHERHPFNNGLCCFVTRG
jgi:hypothetical protein